MLFCPGCECGHRVAVAPSPKAWGWNESMDAPTFIPSYLVHGHKGTTLDGGVIFKDQPTCHSFIRDGNIQFLPDSTHALAGKTVPLPDWKDV